MPTTVSTPTNKTRAKADVPPRALLPATRPEVTEAEIAARAFEIYCARGCGNGRDLDDWLEAERELRSTQEN